MSSIDLPSRSNNARSAALLRLLVREFHLVLVLSILLTGIASLLSVFVVQDTWLALVDGRWIAQHGLPQIDKMTVWGHGAPWVDQQWLAHLALYEVVRAGGLRLLVVVGLALAFCALALAAFAGRRVGGSPPSVGLFLVLAIVSAPWALELRTQLFALPLFVAVYALLVADSRRPSPRVFLVLPLLVLWANLHGSVVLAAGLVTAHGLLSWRRRWLLALLAPAAVLASPYGLQLVPYYHTMLVGSPVREYVLEWRPTTLRPVSVISFLLMFGAIVLLARQGSRLSLFERVALPLLVIAGLLAIRNGVWFGLACVVSLPVVLDQELRPTLRSPSRTRTSLNAAIAGVAIVGAALTVALTVTQPASAFAPFPGNAAAAVARAAGPHGRVLADDEHSDWLLWMHPALVGRLAYDVRFELLSRGQSALLFGFRHYGAHPELARGFRVLTFGSLQEARPFLRRGRLAYRSAKFFMVVQR
jgi:hypothetical protein